jgi:hypothetical protein
MLRRQVPQCCGDRVPQCCGDRVPQCCGDRVPQCCGDRVPQCCGDRVPQCCGDRVPQCCGNRVPQSCGNRVPQSCGNREGLRGNRATWQWAGLWEWQGDHRFVAVGLLTPLSAKAQFWKKKQSTEIQLIKECQLKLRNNVQKLTDISNTMNPMGRKQFASKWPSPARFLWSINMAKQQIFP